MRLKALLAIWAAAALAGCVSASAPPPAWTGGDPARLAADQAACHKETDAIGLGANGYSDSKYGVSSAMAEAIDRDDPLHNHAADARKAAFITCMGDRGWHLG